MNILEFLVAQRPHVKKFVENFNIRQNQPILELDLVKFQDYLNGANMGDDFVTNPYPKVEGYVLSQINAWFKAKHNVDISDCLLLKNGILSLVNPNATPYVVKEELRKEELLSIKYRCSPQNIFDRWVEKYWIGEYAKDLLLINPNMFEHTDWIIKNMFPDKDEDALLEVKTLKEFLVRQLSAYMTTKYPERDFSDILVFKGNTMTYNYHCTDMLSFLQLVAERIITEDVEPKM